jgi:cytochrome P460
MPSGTVFTVVRYSAQLAQGNPIKGADGQSVKGELRGYAVVEKHTGWGSEYPDAPRNGEWEYRAFTAEKKPNENVKLTVCFECHKPTANHDFVYSYDKLTLQRWHRCTRSTLAFARNQVIGQGEPVKTQRSTSLPPARRGPQRLTDGYEIVMQEMQRHRMGIISNFFAEPMGQPAGVGRIRRWSILNRFLFANGLMLHLIARPVASRS